MRSLCITLLGFFVQLAALSAMGYEPQASFLGSKGGDHCSDYTRDLIAALGKMPNFRAAQATESEL